jgi:predicted transcriptional regulator of viral defense system
MDQRTTGKYGHSRGIELASSMARAGLYVFKTEDAVRLRPSEVEPAVVPYLLKVLADAGWIIRLRRGLYAGTGRLPGGVDVPAFALATAMVAPSAISHLSALAYHELTDQIPRVVTASTPRKVVTPSMRKTGGQEENRRHVWRVDGIDCRYVTVIPERFELGLETVWLEERFRVDITDRERTVLDLFALPRMFGGMGEAFSVVEMHLDRIDIEKLVDYAVKYHSIAVAKRVGWTLERAGVDMATLMPLLEIDASHYSPLDPGRMRRGERDRRWMITMNLGQEVVGA